MSSQIGVLFRATLLCLSLYTIHPILSCWSLTIIMQNRMIALDALVLHCSLKQETEMPLLWNEHHCI